jgi:hypothetical protein
MWQETIKEGVCQIEHGILLFPECFKFVFESEIPLEMFEIIMTELQPFISLHFIVQTFLYKLLNFRLPCLLF